jgi:hypothetical protein
METIKLLAGDHVYAAGWNQEPYLTATALVGTAREFARRYDQDEEEAHRRCLDNGHDTAYAMFGGTCLVDDRQLAERMAAERAANRASATELNDGDEVEIEGELFTVRINPRNERRPYNSDPIKFIRKQ